MDPADELGSVEAGVGQQERRAVWGTQRALSVEEFTFALGADDLGQPFRASAAVRLEGRHRLVGRRQLEHVVRPRGGNPAWNTVSCVCQQPTNATTVHIEDFTNGSLARGYLQPSWYMTSVQWRASPCPAWR